MIFMNDKVIDFKENENYFFLKFILEKENHYEISLLIKIR